MHDQSKDMVQHDFQQLMDISLQEHHDQKVIENQQDDIRAIRMHDVCELIQ